MGHTLVLNATYEPLCVVPLKRAVLLVLAEKAIVVESGAGVLRSERRTIPEPRVVRLSRYVRVPHRRQVSLTRRAVLARDGHACAYCGGHAETVDHVVPRSRGGCHAWDNVVAACRRCNHRKADRLLSELGWATPDRPHPGYPTVALLIGYAPRDPTWEAYLPAARGSVQVAL